MKSDNFELQIKFEQQLHVSEQQLTSCLTQLTEAVAAKEEAVAAKERAQNLTESSILASSELLQQQELISQLEEKLLKAEAQLQQNEASVEDVIIEQQTFDVISDVLTKMGIESSDDDEVSGTSDEMNGLAATRQDIERQLAEAVAESAALTTRNGRSQQQMSQLEEELSAMRSQADGGEVSASEAALESTLSELQLKLELSEVQLAVVNERVAELQRKLNEREQEAEEEPSSAPSQEVSIEAALESTMSDLQQKLELSEAQLAKVTAQLGEAARSTDQGITEELILNAAQADLEATQSASKADNEKIAALESKINALEGRLCVTQSQSRYRADSLLEMDNLDSHLDSVCHLENELGIVTPSSASWQQPTPRPLDNTSRKSAVNLVWQDQLMIRSELESLESEVGQMQRNADEAQDMIATHLGMLDVKVSGL